MTSAEVAKMFGAAISGGAGQSARSRAAARRLAEEAQIAALERVLADIRRKARETPAWRHGYESAATSVEAEIASIRAQ